MGIIAMKTLFVLGLPGPSSVFGLPSCLRAQTPQLIHYQGRRLNGTNLVNGNVGLSLRLSDAAAPGSPRYVDSNTFAVAEGLYSLFIGDNTTSRSLRDALSTTSFEPQSR